MYPNYKTQAYGKGHFGPVLHCNYTVRHFILLKSAIMAVDKTTIIKVTKGTFQAKIYVIIQK